MHQADMPPVTSPYPGTRQDQDEKGSVLRQFTVLLLPAALQLPCTVMTSDRVGEPPEASE
jgi:hypothetical protein